MLKGKFGEIFKKGFIILGGISFVWATAAGVVNMVIKPQTKVENSTEIQDQSPEKKLKEAAKGYEMVLEKEPNNRFALQELVGIYLQLGDLQNAVKPLEKLAKLEPKNQDYQDALKKVKAGLDSELTAKNYELVLEKDPNNIVVLRKLTAIYLQSSDLQSAIKPLEKLIQLEPQNKDYQEVLTKIKADLAEKQKTPPPSPQK